MEVALVVFFVLLIPTLIVRAVTRSIYHGIEGDHRREAQAIRDSTITYADCTYEGPPRGWPFHFVNGCTVSVILNSAGLRIYPEKGGAGWSWNSVTSGLVDLQLADVDGRVRMFFTDGPLDPEGVVWIPGESVEQVWRDLDAVSPIPRQRFHRPPNPPGTTRVVVDLAPVIVEAGAGWAPQSLGLPGRLRIFDNAMSIEIPLRPGASSEATSATISLDTVRDVQIAEGSSSTKGPLIIGGGFGLKGAAEGMAVGSILSSLTRERARRVGNRPDRYRLRLGTAPSRRL